MQKMGFVAALAAAALGVNLAEQRSYSAESPEGPPPGNRVNHRMGKRMSAEHYEKHDPAYCISTRSRRGARVAAAELDARFVNTRVGKRRARAAMGQTFVSSPVFKSGKREKAFLAALAGGETRNNALKLARRVPA